MHILVIGSGVTGPPLALLLVRAGHTVELFDRPDIGGGLSLQANSLHVLRPLGLLDELFETKTGEFDHDSWGPVEDLESTKVQMISSQIMKSIRITPVTFSYLDPLPAWHKGNVVLACDAFHAMLPFGGQGTAMGIEDAEATILSKLSDKPREAFALYEECAAGH
ncbi:hypothetical protein HK405_008781 [Cladochytrium tenue]|nr:hypothetical protein HK405_008781 [Cladochytrium tenue]